MNLPLPQTEQRNPRSLRLGSSPVADCLRLILEEDRAVHEALLSAVPTLTAFAEQLSRRFAQGGRLITLGAGTSGRLAVLDAAELAPTFQLEPGRVIALIAGGPAALTTAIEGAEDARDGVRAELEQLQLSAADTVLGISASGRTPYVRGGLALAKQLAPQALTGLLCCSETTSDDCIDHLIVLPTGAEVLTGSTRMKAGTACKQALNALSTTLMVQDGRVAQNLMVAVDACNAKLVDRKARIQQTLQQPRGERPLCWHIRIDSGATKTAVEIEDSGGQIQQLRGPGLNPYELELHQVAQKLQHLLYSLHLESGERLADILAQAEVSAGVAGASRPGFHDLLLDCFAMHGCTRVRLRSDGVELLDSLGDPAVLLIAGTGSVCVGRHGTLRAQAGGLGRVLGDEGSGYAIALQGLRAAFQAADGWGAESALLDATRKHFAPYALNELLYAVNRQQLSKAEIAAFAPEVARCAFEGDATARSILDRAAADLAGLAASVLERLAAQDIPLHCHGGVFASGIGEQLRERIAQDPRIRKWTNRLLCTPA